MRDSFTRASGLTSYCVTTGPVFVPTTVAGIWKLRSFSSMMRTLRAWSRTAPPGVSVVGSSSATAGSDQNLGRWIRGAPSMPGASAASSAGPATDTAEALARRCASVGTTLTRPLPPLPEPPAQTVWLMGAGLLTGRGRSGATSMTGSSAGRPSRGRLPRPRGLAAARREWRSGGRLFVHSPWSGGGGHGGGRDARHGAAPRGDRPEELSQRQVEEQQEAGDADPEQHDQRTRRADEAGEGGAQGVADRAAAVLDRLWRAGHPVEQALPSQEEDQATDGGDSPAVADLGAPLHQHAGHEQQRGQQPGTLAERRLEELRNEVGEDAGARQEQRDQRDRAEHQEQDPDQ